MMKVISSFLLLAALAIAGLPLSRAVKVIYDRRDVIIEGANDTSVVFDVHDERLDDHRFYLYGEFIPISTLSISLRDDDGNRGIVRTGNSNRPDLDAAELSFVVETVDGDEETSPEMRDITSMIWGDVRVRELNDVERKQMQKFKKSSTSRYVHGKFVIDYEQSGRIRIEAQAPEALNLALADPRFTFSFGKAPGKTKSVSIKEFQGKNVYIEDVPRSGNCAKPPSGIQLDCNGEMYVLSL